MIWAFSLSTTKLSPRRLTCSLSLMAFAVCLGLVTSTWPLAHAALYLHHSCQAAVPQYISGRTSYLHVRLEFLLYPQVIPQFCNTGGCEPRWTVTSTSLCSWIAHVVSGRIAATSACFRLGCPLAPQLYRWFTLGDLGHHATMMHSPDHSTKGTPSVLGGASHSDL